MRVMTDSERRGWMRALAVIAEGDRPDSLYARAAAGDNDALEKVVRIFEGLSERFSALDTGSG